MSASQSQNSGDPPSPQARRHRPGPSFAPDERSPLLQPPASSPYARRRLPSGATTPRNIPLSRHHSYTGPHHQRQPSWGHRLATALAERQESMESKRSAYVDDRVWYDQFTSTDWVHDIILDSHRAKALRARRGMWGRVQLFFDASQGWILSAVCGVVIAVSAYCVTVSEAAIFDLKDGYCARGWWLRETACCPTGEACADWREWGDVFGFLPWSRTTTEFGVYLTVVVLFATASCLLTLTTKTVVPSAYRLSTLDENLAAPAAPLGSGTGTPTDGSSQCSTPRPGATAPTLITTATTPTAPTTPKASKQPSPPMVYYSAAGSGVAEVRVILSGFVLHGFLGLKTLLVKMAALILSVASGMSLGKEGPYVHIATCVGNIACRLFEKYDGNDGKRREIMSAAASAGVAVAFGAPLGGVLFGLEEVSYFFPAKTLFRTFFSCIVAALTLKFLNPYGTHKVVMFQVRYLVDWEFFEIGTFIVVGILGGAVGALFIKASKAWAQSFRRTPLIQRAPLVEVVLVAAVTGLLNYWNMFTKLPVANLMLSLASPCEADVGDDDGVAICPSTIDDIPPIVGSLLVALLIKGFLTVITFGIKVPSGIYVPSMVMGGLMGRTIGHLVQWAVLRFPHVGIWSACAASGTATCIQPGVYGLIAAGSTMCGVTRLSVTLAVILFELTGSLDYVLPFSLAILVAKWTADWIEPNSIYDLLTNLNSYPFLDNKRKPVFTSELGDIVPGVRRERVIDISSAPVVPATALRIKLELLHRAGELDGGLPILRDGILVGLIPAPELAFALDQLPDEETALCLMASVPTIEDDDDENDSLPDPSDFTRYIDPAPVALDIKSPIDLVYECFVKLGLRYICVTKNGRYAGMTHKKSFVKYMRHLEEEQGH